MGTLDDVKAGLFKLAGNDFFKGAVVAVIGAIGTALLAVLNTGALPTGADLKQILIVGVTAGVSYLVKNLLTNSQGKMLTKEPPKE